ncbi:alpha/beta fold hydrolase [Phytohabitans houttuyneae]|jgi:pimeloyl-ACP methyl ester carboxylesterase|uniref:Putative hydrolase YraK n=1 Tax=Phytohabitans houttuyneae TaxID=1076126 RepID=A0A6V8KQA4_9ACTN|nr:alpha/beta fold hydrolase [Phytohabitans houttuyneae]GFJ84429.1 putative hydrolase YraK [Phytohabitans houttuyneae]
METKTLSVPGASLHYEVRGAGPVLLLICGGVYDAAAFAPLAQELADRYTVVTYDRRGNSRSRLDGAPGPQAIEEHGDDAYRVLAAVGVSGAAPAYVFGNSSGAIIGLELAARHPELVRVLVAHEPPLFELLPEREHWRDVMREVEAAYRDGGSAAAGQVLGAALGMSGAPSGDEGEDRVPGGAEAPPELDPQTAAMLARFAANNEFFLEFEVPPFARYVPDGHALKSGSTRVVPAAGAASEGEPPARAAHAVGALLGVPVATFPGDHGGFGLETALFARRLDDVLRAA